MPVIKRYPNRKLYDTEAKRYVTLGGIAKLIRQGDQVQVVDHASGEDLTTLTLTQIILEQEKRRSGFIPQVVLTGLIQSGGHTLGVLRRTLASSLGLLRQVDEEIERRVYVLIERGELLAEEGLRLCDKLLAPEVKAGNRMVGEFDVSEQDLEQVLLERWVPTREEFQQLTRQLDALAAKLDSIGR